MMKIKRTLLWALMLLLTSQFSVAQAFRIEVTVDGIADTTMMLGHHFGEKKFVIDTVMADSKGMAVFEGDEPLDRGIYIIVLPSEENAYFELLVDEDQKFSLHTKVGDYVNDMKVKGSKSNAVFNEYQRRMGDLQTDIIKYQDRIKELGEDSDSVKIYKDMMASVGEERLEYMKQIVAENKDNLFGKIINAIMDPEIPDPPKDENGNIKDSTFQYRYYRKHYFDNIDFTESGLLRTPILKARVNNYFKNVVPPVADTVIPEANAIIEKCRQDSTMFRFMVSHLLNYFETSHIMGMDKVFVDLAETWYLSGEAYWADSTLIEKIEERVRKITPNILGEIAPDIAKVPTYHGEYASLHAIDADYTILVFWEPNCGHCKKVVPKLYEVYKDTLRAKGVEVFAVYTQVDKEEWTEFIEDKGLDLWYNVYDPYGFSNFRNNYDIYSTPVIYILDKDKRIIAKRIDVDYITKFIDYHKEKLKKEAEEKANE